MKYKKVTELEGWFSNEVHDTDPVIISEFFRAQDEDWITLEDLLAEPMIKPFKGVIVDGDKLICGPPGRFRITVEFEPEKEDTP
jgi:hypothetical protein